MRLWSLHPKHLDQKGLVALWREALLAKAVLAGKTRGYRNHPQLERFRASKKPLAAINLFLKSVYDEACLRGYCFDDRKFTTPAGKVKISVGKGQVKYEAAHLLKKLKVRDKARAKTFKSNATIELNPLFTARAGGVEKWERPAPRGNKAISNSQSCATISNNQFLISTLKGTSK